MFVGTRMRQAAGPMPVPGERVAPAVRIGVITGPALGNKFRAEAPDGLVGSALRMDLHAILPPSLPDFGPRSEVSAVNSAKRSCMYDRGPERIDGVGRVLRAIRQNLREIGRRVSTDFAGQQNAGGSAQWPAATPMAGAPTNESFHGWLLATFAIVGEGRRLPRREGGVGRARPSAISPCDWVGCVG